MMHATVCRLQAKLVSMEFVFGGCSLEAGDAVKISVSREGGGGVARSNKGRALGNGGVDRRGQRGRTWQGKAKASQSTETGRSTSDLQGGVI
jgi:hypothetical protein